jgi:hypothetical protein
MGTVQIDHQKDVTGFGQRLGRQAGSKIDASRPWKAGTLDHSSFLILG